MPTTQAQFFSLAWFRFGYRMSPQWVVVLVVSVVVVRIGGIHVVVWHNASSASHVGHQTHNHTHTLTLKLRSPRVAVVVDRIHLVMHTFRFRGSSRAARIKNCVQTVPQFVSCRVVSCHAAL